MCYHSNYLDCRSRAQGDKPPNWSEWKYVQRMVNCHTFSVIHFLMEGSFFPFFKDQPSQTNGFDCGVFASQVKLAYSVCCTIITVGVFVFKQYALCRVMDKSWDFQQV